MTSTSQPDLFGDADEVAKHAAVRAVNPDTLLDGEDPSSVHREEAEHWVAAYSELINYKDSLLLASADSLSLMTTDAAIKEFTGVDVVILGRQVAKFRRRLAFWVQRREELRPG